MRATSAAMADVAPKIATRGAGSLTRRYYAGKSRIAPPLHRSGRHGDPVSALRVAGGAASVTAVEARRRRGHAGGGGVAHLGGRQDVDRARRAGAARRASRLVTTGDADLGSGPAGERPVLLAGIRRMADAARGARDASARVAHLVRAAGRAVG